MPTFLRVEAVAERYQTTVHSIHHLTRSNRIPLLDRPGIRGYLFRLDHLDAWDDGAELEVVELPSGGKMVRPKEAA